MNRQKILLTCVLIAAAMSLASYGFQTDTDAGPEDNHAYTPSDIATANPNLVVAPAEPTYRTTSISDTKDTVLLSVSGTVTSVGDPIDWVHEGDKYGAVPVTININMVAKDKESPERPTSDMQTEPKQRSGTLTFYVSGIYEQDRHYVFGFEPGFEIGEYVIVHLGKSTYGPDGKDGDNYFVELGKFGKYKIVDDVAYNQKHPTGRSLDAALGEAN